MNDSLTIHGTFNFSKMMDSGGWRDQTYRIPYRQIDGNDHTLRATLSGVYQLPVGRGRMILPRMNRMVDTVVGGWELGSLYIFQSGAPWILPGNPNEVYLHNAYVKPHIQADNGYIRMVGACAEKWSETGTVYSLTPLAFDTDNTCPNGANFMAQPSFSPYPDNIYTGIRLLRNHQFDANLSKNFTILEGLKLQMRMEAFNVLNHPLWGQGPDGSTNDTTFGTIERGTWGQSNLPRQMQLSAKIVW
jgi:hypothetical protein